MLDVKIILPLILAAAACGAAAAPGDTNEFTRAVALQAVTRAESGPGIAPAQRAYVTVGGARMAFLVPPGLSLVPGDGSGVRVANRDGSVVIELKAWAAGGHRTADELIRPALAAYPEARPGEQLSGTVCNRDCPGLDFQWSPPQGLPQRGRLWLLRLPDTTLTLCVNADGSRFAEATRAFDTVLVTLVRGDGSTDPAVMPLSDLL